jgi:hypothetical protein
MTLTDAFLDYVNAPAIVTCIAFDAVTSTVPEKVNPGEVAITHYPYEVAWGIS